MLLESKIHSILVKTPSSCKPDREKPFHDPSKQRAVDRAQFGSTDEESDARGKFPAGKYRVMREPGRARAAGSDVCGSVMQ